MVAIIFLLYFTLILVQQIQIVASYGFLASAEKPQAIKKVAILSHEKITDGFIWSKLGYTIGPKS